MAFSKSPLYPPEDQITSGYARALSHPARLMILRKLASDGPCSVQILNHAHPISQPAMSYHLEILRKAHLVSCKEKFPFSIYTLEGKSITLAEYQLKSFFRLSA